MKLFKINENHINNILGFLGELPIKHQGLINAMAEIIKGLEELIEPKEEKIED